MRLLTAPATTISHLQAVGWATGHKARLAGRRHDVFEILLLLLVLLVPLLLLLLQLLLLLLARLTLAGRAASTPGKGGPGRPTSSGQVPAECERGRPTGHLRAAGGVRRAQHEAPI